MAVNFYVPWSSKFWTCYLVHMRPYLWFVSGMAGMAGVFINTNYIDLKVALSIFPFFLSYGFGQALTDCFQVDTDKLSAPYRPLSQGLINKNHVAIISVIGLVFCGAILVYLNWINLVFVLLSIVGLGTYTCSKKNLWFLGPLHNSVIVSMLPVMGYFSFVSYSAGNEFDQLKQAALVIFLAYNVFVLMGYLKDISADRESGYKTFPVVWGWDLTVVVSNFSYIITFYLIYRNGWIHDSNWGFFISALLVASTGQIQAYLQKIKNEDTAFFSIGQTVRSFLIICYIIIYHNWSTAFWYLITCHILFEIIFNLRPDRRQI